MLRFGEALEAWTESLRDVRERLVKRACSVRGRSERWFGTVQGRLPQELKLEGVADMSSANRYLVESFWPRMNRRFGVEARERTDPFATDTDSPRRHALELLLR